MVLRSHSRAGRSESSIPERCGGANRPEPEMAQPEMVDASDAGRDLRNISDSPGIDSGETVETLSGPSFPDRQKPEMEITPRPAFPHSSSTDPHCTPGESFTDSLAPLLESFIWLNIWT